MLVNERIPRGKKKEDNDDVPLVYIKLFQLWKTTHLILKEIDGFKFRMKRHFLTVGPF